MEAPRPTPRKDVRYSETAYRALKEAILSGQLPAEKPLIEEALAGLLNISRTPVREALTILEHEGLIGPRHGRGLYVRPITRAEFVEIFNANEVVAQELARRAARLATDELLQMMSEQVARELYYANQGELPEFLRASRGFIGQLGEAAENRPLASFLVANQERIDLYLLGVERAVALESITALARHHENLLAAFIRRDPDEAARLVIYQAQWLREHFAALYESQLPSGEDEPDEFPDRSVF